jgi:hypothetical protein
MTRLGELVTAASESPTFKAAYLRNPDAFMNAFELTEDEKIALRSGDPQQIQAAIGQPIGDKTKMNLVIT